KHYNSLFEMPEQEYSALMTIARAIAYSLLLSQGAVNIDMLYTQELRRGNFTPHALIHVIPRYKDDEISYNWNTDIPSQEEFSAMAEKIRSAIESIKSSAAPSQAPAEPAPVPEDKTEQPDNKKDTSPEVKRRTIIF
ncbi:hypothetical protein M1293_03815, partial [Candidatus Parvarchaeota archaeon]|nr:hypothetical protein [Candidatus Parvarchaeota archaeon]